ncbi:MAG: rhomboid family intramembrane serine protease [Spirochaetota bacterium]|nr:rhomboid family intramembrane serine protease [Spirochaetota bacterium]
MDSQTRKSSPFVDKLILSALLIGAMWVLAILDLLIPTAVFDVNSHGIKPRTAEGIYGILFSPFLHQDLDVDYRHIVNNSLFLIFLLPITLIFNGKAAIKEIIVIILIGGVLVWVFGGTNTNHIGASGLIYGLISLLFIGGIIKRELKSILGAVVAFFAYSVVLFGFLPKSPGEMWRVMQAIWGNFFSGLNPGQSGVSWEGHLFGAVAGVLAAILFKNQAGKETAKEK